MGFAAATILVVSAVVHLIQHLLPAVSDALPKLLKQTEFALA
jgi:hypothetical protein